MQSVELKDALHRVRPGGCVRPYLEDFAAELFSSGYAELSTVDYVRSASHLGRWMDLRHIGVDQLSDATLAGFAQHHCQCPHATRHRRRPSRCYVARVRKFAEYLGRLGVIPPLARQPPKAVPTLLLGFRTWMIRHRGITERTIARYERLIERMLPALGSNPAIYDAALVRRVLLDEIRSLSCPYAKTFVTALRAFLRFLAAEGRCQPYLDRALPTVPEWRLSALPRYLEAADVERLIAACDLNTSHGIRDRAILLLLARLGLRAGDIMAMQLDDLDWDAATVRVQGKGRKAVCLPLPQDAGEALLEYLVNARPSANTNRVFLCVNAPIRPFATSASIADIVRLALRRAGITTPPSKGAHLLRHSAATAMLRSGASLDTIATVLRHTSTDTTAYYAKVDIELLRQIAQPWPEGAPC
jgi:integrase/recombinase XerD